jgi:NhaA family Na+:H+ antiporter
VVPALIYVAFTHGNPVYIHGWAVPSATDIAFALGVLALVGSRVPAALKAFVMILAVLDDLAAIIIIALFYTDDLSLQSLAWAGVFTAVLFALNRARVRHIGVYMLVGAALWTTVLKSGVHATLAGVVVALAIPMDSEDGKESLADQLIHTLHPWINFFIVPVFAFANAGVTLLGLGRHDLVHPVTLGIVLGLFLGKQFGITACAWLMVKLGLAELPARNWREFYGAAVLCGIGFTMSLFISSLAFANAGGGIELADRLGILAGSLLSAVVGWALLRQATKPQPAPVADT